MKKITFILGSMNRGGAERVISILSNDYAEKGWKVDIVLLLYNTVAYELNSNIHIVDFSGSTTSRNKRVLYWLKSIRHYIKTEQPDIVLSFAARINILTQLACVGLKQKIFVSERNDPYYDGRSKIIDIATVIFYPKANAVVFQTKRAMGYFPKLKNGIIIANPIAVKQYACKNSSKKIVVVGRLTEQKNHKMLFRAFTQVIKEFPEYVLEVYGQGELENELKILTKELEIQNKVFFMGNVSDIHEHISDAELFVLSSNYEGLSNALLEAMMMGLPCISTDCAGSDEYIRDGKNGLLVPVGDGNAMAKAICRMLTDKNFRIACGKQARMDAVDFSKETILKKWHALMD